MGRKRKDIIESDEVKISRTPRKWNPISREMIESSSGDEEDIEICPVCQDKNDPSNPGDEKNRMIGCDGCDKWYTSGTSPTYSTSTRWGMTSPALSVETTLFTLSMRYPLYSLMPGNITWRRRTT